MERNSQLLRKPSKTLVMIPKVGKLTVIFRKIYNVLLQKTQTEISEKRIESKDPKAQFPGTHSFSLPLAELTGFITSNRAENSDAGMVKVVKECITSLTGTQVVWDSPDANSEVDWGTMVLLSQGNVRKKDGLWTVFWALPPALLIEVSDPTMYARFDLAEVSKLKHYSSICLYEICSRYKDNPTKLTSKNSPDWWVDALTQSPATADKPRRQWRKLKAEAINESIEEINSKTDLTINLIEIKSGRAVSEIQFSVEKKKAQEARAINRDHEDVINHAARLGVDIGTHLKSAPATEIKFVLSKLEGRLAGDHEKIENKQAYFNKMLRDTPTTVMTTVAAPAPATSPTPPTPNTSNIYTRMNAEFDLLSDSEQDRYVALLQEDMKLVNNSKAVQKLAEGIWSNGLIRMKLTDKYATEKYGSNWATNPDIKSTQGAPA